MSENYKERNIYIAGGEFMSENQIRLREAKHILSLLDISDDVDEFSRQLQGEIMLLQRKVQHERETNEVPSHD